MFLPLIVLSAVIGGLYGIIHDQLTYTISPEYYFKFKFITFRIPEELHNRDGAGIVGWMATWWMGMLLGTIYATLNYFLFDKGLFFKLSLRAVLITLLVTFVGGMLGLLYGLLYLSHQPATYFSGWFIPDGLVDLKHFIMVGSMHNGGYLGAAAGLLISIGYLVNMRQKNNAAS